MISRIVTLIANRRDQVRREGAAARAGGDVSELERTYNSVPTRLSEQPASPPAEVLRSNQAVLDDVRRAAREREEMVRAQARVYPGSRKTRRMRSRCVVWR